MARNIGNHNCAPLFYLEFNPQCVIITGMVTNETCVIYRALFPNGKCYVGQSWNYEKRLRAHKCRNNCRHFANARDKHGWDNIVWSVLAECDTQSTADYLEKHYIVFYDSVDNGYNLALGGASGKHSEETKRRMSKNNARARKGKKHTNEARQKISKNNARGMLGRKHTEAARRKMSMLARGRRHSEETRRKISENHATRKK